MIHYIKIIFLILPSFLFSETTISGDINFYSAFRSSNSELIRLPYRLSNINIINAKNDLQFNTTISIEHNIKKGIERLDDSNVQDFLIDIRELYITFYNNIGEFKIGKQIHSWGMVDENSPLDNINGYDYYYLFLGGSDRKIGAFSSSFEIYYNDWKLGMHFSPIHNTNRIPIDDPYFPIELAALPPSNQIITSSKNKMEFGGYIQKSFSNSDFRLSYFDGYDRLFNFSGLNIFQSINAASLTDMNDVEVDIVYSYRKTKMVGFGSTILFDNMVLRSDLGYFNTKDQNQNIIRENPNYDGNPFIGYPEIAWISLLDSTLHTYPMKEKAEYLQYTIQLEYQLPYEINSVVQIAGYDLNFYESENYELPDPEEVSIPQYEGDELPEIDPKKIFTPGMGTSISTLTTKALILNFQKRFFQDRLNVNFLSLLDINNSRLKISNDVSNLREISFEYKVSDGFKVLGAINKITGDKNHEDGTDYTFNQMENFSHYRLEIKYYF